MSPRSSPRPRATRICVEDAALPPPLRGGGRNPVPVPAHSACLSPDRRLRPGPAIAAPRCGRAGKPARTRRAGSWIGCRGVRGKNARRRRGPRDFPASKRGGGNRRRVIISFAGPVAEWPPSHGGSCNPSAYRRSCLPGRPRTAPASGRTSPSVRGSAPRRAAIDCDRGPRSIAGKRNRDSNRENIRFYR